VPAGRPEGEPVAVQPGELGLVSRERAKLAGPGTSIERTHLADELLGEEPSLAKHALPVGGDLAPDRRRITGHPIRPAASSRVRQVRVKHDLPANPGELERGVADQEVIRMPVERAGGVERHPGVHTLSDPLGDLVRKDLSVAVLIVEQAELHRGSADDRECRSVLLTTLTHPLHRIHRPRRTGPTMAAVSPEATPQRR
jgi:hypothetical protein